MASCPPFLGTSFLAGEGVTECPKMAGIGLRTLGSSNNDWRVERRRIGFLYKKCPVGPFGVQAIRRRLLFCLVRCMLPWAPCLSQRWGLHCPPFPEKTARKGGRPPWRGPWGGYLWVPLLGFRPGLFLGRWWPFTRAA